MQNTVIITAGGIGKRMGAAIPKQFLLLKGKPILMHTIERFFQFDANIQVILALPKGQIDTWKKKCDEYAFSFEHTIVEGGKERFHSVLNALANVSGGVVGVHDAVRPLVSVEVIKTCFEMAIQHKAVIPVVGLKQSIRRVESTHSVAVDRSIFRLVQTPQCFTASILKQAYSAEYQQSFTDDASVVEQAGQSITLVEGNEENIKITTPLDLKLAEILI